MKLIILRHAETLDNVDRVVQGHRPGMLSELGEKQARSLVFRLAGEKIDTIYCSDLQRARDTLGPYLIESNRQAIYTVELRERNYGEFEGLPYKFFLEAKGDASFKDDHFRPEGGESWQDVRLRTTSFLGELQQRHPGQSVLVCSHGGTIRVLLNSYPAIGRTEVVPNASLSYLVFDQQGNLLEHEVANKEKCEVEPTPRPLS